MDISRKSAIKAIGALISSPILSGITSQPSNAGKETANASKKTNSLLSPLLGFDQFSGMEFIGRLKPRRSETIASSRWGVQLNHYRIPEDEINLWLERVAKSGVKWSRFMTLDYAVSPEAGYYRMDELDQIINGLKKRKIEPYITINKVDQLEYVKALVERYHDRVTYWEIRNEPEINEAYAMAVKAASKLIKGIDLEAKILAGSLPRVDVEGLQKLLEEFGVAPAVDVITFHPYNEFPEGIKYNIELSVRDGYELSSHLASELRELIEKQQQSIALWQGECGYPSSSYTRSWKGRGPWGEYIQAKWLLRRFITDYSMDIPVSSYFMLYEEKKGKRVNAKGLHKHANWNPKPAYAALQHITSLFNQRLMEPKSIEVDIIIHDEGSFNGVKGENNRDPQPFSSPKAPYPIQTIGLSGSGGTAVAFYIPWRMQEYVEPAQISLAAEGLLMQDPVLVDLLTGKVYKPKTKNSGGLLLQDIPLTDYPFVAVEKELVSLLKA